MALRDQPYLPLYIQDFLTDEKLAFCSAKAHGVYIRLMCLMHKSEHYGKILLRQNDWQNPSKDTSKNLTPANILLETITAFANQLAKQMPYPIAEIQSGLSELVSEGVLKIDGDFLVQKRMVADFQLSEARAKSGRKGASKRYFAMAKPLANGVANSVANSENESENENENESKDEEGLENTGGDPNFNVEAPPPNPTIPVQHVFTFSVLDVHECVKVYFTGNNYAESRDRAMMRMGIKDDATLRDWAELFADEMIIRGDRAKTMSEFVQHFYSWLQRKDMSRDPKTMRKKDEQKVIMLSPTGQQVAWTLQEYEQRKSRTEYKYLKHA